MGEGGRVGLVDADWPGHRAGAPSRFDMRPGPVWLGSWVGPYLLAGLLYTLATALAVAGRNVWVQPLGAFGYIGTVRPSLSPSAPNPRHHPRYRPNPTFPGPAGGSLLHRHRRIRRRRRWRRRRRCRRRVRRAGVGVGGDDGARGAAGAALRLHHHAGPVPPRPPHVSGEHDLSCPSISRPHHHPYPGPHPLPPFPWCVWRGGPRSGTARNGAPSPRQAQRGGPPAHTKTGTRLVIAKDCEPPRRRFGTPTARVHCHRGSFSGLSQGRIGLVRAVDLSGCVASQVPHL